jgi:hypothetical protein
MHVFCHRVRHATEQIRDATHVFGSAVRAELMRARLRQPQHACNRAKQPARLHAWHRKKRGG